MMPWQCSWHWVAKPHGEWAVGTSDSYPLVKHLQMAHFPVLWDIIWYDWYHMYIYIYIELNIDRCKSPAFSKLSQNMNGLRLDLRSTLQRFILFGAHSGRYLKYRKVKAMLPQPTMDSQPEDEAFPPVSCLTWRREIRPFLKREIYGNIIEINAGFSMSQMWNNVKVTWIKSQVRIDFCKCQPPDLRFWASQSTYWWVMSLVYFRPPLFLSFSNWSIWAWFYQNPPLSVSPVAVSLHLWLIKHSHVKSVCLFNSRRNSDLPFGYD